MKLDWKFIIRILIFLWILSRIDFNSPWWLWVGLIGYTGYIVMEFIKTQNKQNEL